MGGHEMKRLPLESPGQTDQVGRDRPAAHSRPPDFDEDDLPLQVSHLDLRPRPPRPEPQLLDSRSPLPEADPANDQSQNESDDACHAG